MFRKWHTASTLPLWYFTLFFTLAMFLPRLVTKGLFGDGLLYASMARNMAIEKGSLWQPFFSSGYWLDGLPTIYYENPPLMLWLESHFFRFLGDIWWVEKLYCGVIFGLNVYLILQIGQLLERKYEILKGMGWLTLFFWMIIPRMLWGNPNNMMDCSLLLWCHLSILFILNMILQTRFNLVYGLLASGSIGLGILTKGPVALYPLAIPILFTFFIQQNTYKKAIFQTFLLTSITVFFFAALFYWNPAAKYYFQQYWEQRLYAVIVGSRTDMKLVGWERLELLETLSIELLPIAGVFLIAFIGLKIKKVSLQIHEITYQLGSFFLFLGFSATLPILASTKQSGIYLIPGLSMFAFSATFFALPFFQHWLSTTHFERFAPKLKSFSLLALGVTLLYTAALTGTYGRDEKLLRDIEKMKNIIPKDAKIGVTPALMSDFTIHTNLQRFGRYELSNKEDVAFFLTLKQSSDTTLLTKNFKPLNIETQYFTIYKKEF